MSNAAAYETDFHAWAHEQARLLRESRFADIDIAHIAEELESMGRSERRELVSRLDVLMAHLLKWQAQPGLRSRSWELTIAEQRRQVSLLLDDNPSLAAALDQFVPIAYRGALLSAQRETGFPASAFPQACPFRAEHLLDPGFLPT